MKTLNLDNHIEIHYQFINEALIGQNKPIIVFLHEGLGSIPQWKKFPTNLCHELNLPGLVFERYGYGHSTPLRELRTYKYLEQEGLERCPEFIQKLGLKNPLILFGHSDGGSVALIMASVLKPQTIGVISIAAHLFLEDISIDGILEAIKVFERDDKFKRALERYHGPRTESAFYGWAHTWTNPDFKLWNIEKYLQNIEAPTMAIQGTLDQYGSEAQVDSIINGVKGRKEKLMLENIGHVPHIEAPELMMEHCSRFIKQCLANEW